MRGGKLLGKFANQSFIVFLDLPTAQKFARVYNATVEELELPKGDYSC